MLCHTQYNVQYPWQSLTLWHLKFGGPGVLCMSSHRSLAAYSTVQTDVRERLPLNLVIIGACSLSRRRYMPENGREQAKARLSVQFPSQAKLAAITSVFF